MKKPTAVKNTVETDQATSALCRKAEAEAAAAVFLDIGPMPP